MDNKRDPANYVIEERFIPTRKWPYEYTLVFFGTESGLKATLYQGSTYTGAVRAAIEHGCKDAFKVPLVELGIDG